MKKSILLAILTIAMAATAHADSINFNYHFVGGSNVADLYLSGTLIGTDKYLVTSGTLLITAGAAIGSYTLFAGGPNVFTSAASGFQADNILFSTKNPAFDMGGLLFTAGSGSTLKEINLFSGGSKNDYTLYRWRKVGGLDILHDGAASLTDVPEPASLSLLGIGTLCLSVFGIKRRWNQKTRAA